MIAAALATAIAGWSVLPVEVPGLYPAAPDPYGGESALAARAADLDGDGRRDWLTPAGAVLQGADAFATAALVPWPEMRGAVDADVWQDALYLRSARGLHVYGLEAGAWKPVFTCDAEWPAGAPADRLFERRGAPGHVLLERFLHDVDADGTPEMVTVAGDGVYVFRAGLAGCAASGPYRVLPALQVDDAPAQSVWPPAARRLRLPARDMNCRVAVLGDWLELLRAESAPGGRVVFVRQTYPGLLRVAPADAPPAAPQWRTGPVPAFMRPCRLNGDDTIDFAGVRWFDDPASPGAPPLLDTWVTLDGGASMHVERARLPRGCQPRVHFADLDGDGDADLVAEESGLFDGGPRERLLRYAMDRSIAHTVRAYLQDALAFDAQPRHSLTVSIDLGGPLSGGGRMALRYAAGGIADCTGDFDGDRRRDVAVRVREDRIGLYRLGPGGYESAPALEIAVPADADPAMADVDGDGRSDLVLPPAMPGGAARVLLLRGGA